MADKKTVTRPVVDAHVHLFPARVAARASDNIVRFYGIPREGDGSAEGLLEACASFADVRFVICAAALGLSGPSAGPMGAAASGSGAGSLTTMGSGHSASQTFLTIVQTT